MGEKSNPKPNLKSFGAPNPKIMGEKSYPNPNTQNPKFADIQPEIELLASLFLGAARASGRPPPEARREDEE